MKKFKWSILLSIVLFALFLFFNFIHYLVYKDVSHLLKWNLTSLAFLPISVFFVTFIMDGLFEYREKRIRVQKLNMVISLFFSNLGTKILYLLSCSEKNTCMLNTIMQINNKWTDRDFKNAKKIAEKHKTIFHVDKNNFAEMAELLKSKEDFLLRILENPTLIEHEQFTDLLRCIMHLREEFEEHTDFTAISDADYNHLKGDIERIYGYLIPQWLTFMQDLKNNYPYLFSLAARKNPFNKVNITN